MKLKTYFLIVISLALMFSLATISYANYLAGVSEKTQKSLNQNLSISREISKISISILDADVGVGSDHVERIADAVDKILTDAKLENDYALGRQLIVAKNTVSDVKNAKGLETKKKLLQHLKLRLLEAQTAARIVVLKWNDKNTIAYNNIYRYMISGSILFLFVVISIFYILYYLVVRPLDIFSTSIRTHSPGDKLRSGDSARIKDIENLYQSFEQMDSKLVKTIRDLSDSKNDLQMALGNAQKATQAKSEFLATMSHEFRTPLNAILGFSEMLRAQYFGPLGAENYSEYVNDIHKSGEHMLALVNDVLDISAIEAGKHRITKEAIMLKDELVDCARSFKAGARQSEIDLSFEVPDSLPIFYADKRSIIQIIQNLVSNALKFTNRGGVVVVSVVATEQTMKIEVKDSGIGISPGLLKIVTEPFSQSLSDPYVAQLGTGLGLSIVKSLVEIHDGRLSIDSEVGEGTTVTVTFPLHDDNGLAALTAMSVTEQDRPVRVK